MHGLGFMTYILLTAITLIACSPVKPKATDYKEKLSAGTTATPKPTTGASNPATGTPTTPTGNSGTPAAATGNAQNGLAILNANCETAGCHKDNGIMLTKTTALTEATGAKVAHRGVQPVFTPSNIEDMKAALATR